MAGGVAAARRRWLVGLLGLAAIVAGLVMALRKDPSELPVYVTAAERLLENHRIHLAADAKPFTYPPFFALPFLPWAWIGDPQGLQWLHRSLWYLVNLGLLAYAAWRLDARLCQGVGSGARRLWFWLLLGLLSGRHVAAVFQNQSHDLFVLAALVAAFDAAVRGGHLRAGAWLGFGAACKATPLLYVPYFLWQRRLLPAVAVAAVFVGLSLLPDAFFRSDTGRTYMSDWYHTFLTGMNPLDEQGSATAAAAGAWEPWNYRNQSLSGTLYRLLTPIEREDAHHYDVSLAALEPRTIKWLSYGVMATLLGAFWWVTRRRPAAEPASRPDASLRLAAEYGLLACGMVLFSPMSSKSHFCVLLLGHGALAATLLYRRRDLALAGLTGLVVVLNLLTTKGIIGDQIGRVVLAVGPVTILTLVTVLALMHLLFHAGYRARPGAEAEVP